MGLHILVFWRSFIVSDIGILFELGLGFAYFSILEVGLDHLIFWNCLASNAHLFLPGEFFGLTLQCARNNGKGQPLVLAAVVAVATTKCTVLHWGSYTFGREMVTQSRHAPFINAPLIRAPRRRRVLKGHALFVKLCGHVTEVYACSAGSAEFGLPRPKVSARKNAPKATTRINGTWQESEELREDVFKSGRFPVQILKIPHTTTHGSTTPAAPKPLLLAVPDQPGEYPVLLFFHGYLFLNSFYSQLLHHIASHGYIAIAPQMYRVTGADATPEIADAAAICDWLPEGLSSYLPDENRPDFQNVAMAGHSRGGKVAFGLALGRTSQTTKLNFSALVGLDPVDGMARGHQTQPRILTYKPQSFDFIIPSLVIGSGLGPLKRNPFFPPCAPEGVSHREFFNECRAPAYHFVPSDYGHVDFLDDETGGIRGKWSYCLCKNGVSREPMRRFCGGIMVAFLNAYLRNDSAAFNDILIHPSHAPVKLERPQSLVPQVEQNSGESLLRRTV